VERRLIPGASPMEPIVGYSRAVVHALLDPVWLVEIEAEAVVA
jgi:hypothetical protein